MGGSNVAEARENRQMPFFDFASDVIGKIRMVLTGIRPSNRHHFLLVGQKTVINSCT